MNLMQGNWRNNYEYHEKVSNDHEIARLELEDRRNDSYAMSSSGGIVSLFNMVTFDALSEFLLPPPAATFLVFNPVDNNIVAIGREDAEISIFKHNELIMKLKGHHKYITDIVFSP